jgi:hypothetical protein
MSPPSVAPGPLARCGPIRQAAFVVRDLDAAVGWWAAIGVGPFLAMPRQRMRGYVHRGESVEPELTLAFANSGELQIELIATHDNRPSPFRDALHAGREGAHHLAWWVADWTGWEHAATEAGWDAVTHGDGGGFARFAYYDIGGPVLAEVMELNDATRWLTDAVRSAHRVWDGSEPRRALY